MTLAGLPSPAALLRVAEGDLDSVVELTAELVGVPSRGGIDSYDPVLDLAANWLGARGLQPIELRDPAGGRVGVVCEVEGARPGARWVLNACLDTAPFGDESRWTYPPVAAVLREGWLWGRGAADSKVGAAIFCHIAARLAEHADDIAGRVVVLLDADEHTGAFGGARSFFDDPSNAGTVDGVYIGYPGIDELVVGSRGVLRVELTVHGVAGHSGAKAPGPNAVVKASELVAALSAGETEGPTSVEFPLQPRVSVTAIHGGEGYTVTPDRCVVSVDARTTPGFDSDAALRLINVGAGEVDQRWPGTAPTAVRVVHDWPPYVLVETSDLRAALLRAAEALGMRLTPKISGPSNIGNYLATLGVPATAGFGVRYRGLHAVDERIEAASIPAVQATYHAAVLDLLRPALSTRR